MLRFARQLLLSFPGSGSLLAHDGHDHGAPPPAAISNLAPRTEAASEQYELVAIARGGDLVIYLDRFATNESVDGASIEVETPAGPQPARAMANEPYRLSAPWSGKPGSYDLIFTVSKDGIDDVLPATLVIPPDAWLQRPERLRCRDIGSGIRELSSRYIPTALMAGLGGFAAGIVVMTVMRRRSRPAMILILAGMLAMFSGAARAHDGDDHDAPGTSNPAVRDLAQRLPDGGVFVPKSTQRILAIRTVTIESAAHRRALELPGRIIPDPNASGFVQPSVGGRLVAAAGRLSAARDAGARRATCSPMSRRRCRRSTSPTCASGRANSISRSPSWSAGSRATRRLCRAAPVRAVAARGHPARAARA